MILLYAVEAWVLAIVCWAWITLRALVPNRPLLDETCAYATLLVSTLNLFFGAVLREHETGVAKAYLGFTLTLWTYMTYAIFDGIYIWDTGSRLLPQDGSCCPNRDVAEMNRAFYFGGLSYYLAPSGLTLAFQTVQVFVASGALVSLKGSIWPGNGWGYSCGFLLSLTYTLRFFGYPELPCPPGVGFFGMRVDYGPLFATFTACLLLFILLDGMMHSLLPVLQYISRAVGVVLVTLFCLTVVAASDGRGMLTVPLIFLLAKAWFPVGWGFVEPFLPAQASAEPVQQPERRSRRWVVPMTTDLPGPDMQTCIVARQATKKTA